MTRQILPALRRLVPWAAITAVIIILSLPNEQLPRVYPDSAGYLALKWGRLPTTWVFFSLFGTEYGACVAQAILSVICWSTLGWNVLGAIGAAVCGVIAASSAVSVYNTTVLSDSLNLSLTALALAATLFLGRRWTWGRLVSWAVVILVFANIRFENQLLALFLYGALFLWYCTRPRRWIPIALVAVLTESVVLFFGIGRDPQLHNWDAGTTNMVLMRIMTDPSEAAKLDLPVEELTPYVGKINMYYAFEDGFDFAAATPQYQRWLHGEAYYRFPLWVVTHLLTAEDIACLIEDSSRGAPGQDSARVPNAVANMLFLGLHWWWALLAVPLICVVITRRIAFTDLYVGMYMVAVYSLTCIVFYGDFKSCPAEYFGLRHMIMAATLYRLAPVIALGSVYERIGTARDSRG